MWRECKQEWVRGSPGDVPLTPHIGAGANPKLVLPFSLIRTVPSLPFINNNNKNNNSINNNNLLGEPASLNGQSLWIGTPLPSATLLGDAPPGMTEGALVIHNKGIFFFSPVSMELKYSHQRGRERERPLISDCWGAEMVPLLNLVQIAFYFHFYKIL